MAWHCSGRNNAELIKNMHEHGILHVERVVQVSAVLFAILFVRVTNAKVTLLHDLLVLAPPVLQAMTKVDRVNYVVNTSCAYEDSPQLRLT
jgi:hypothetical protein